MNIRLILILQIFFYSIIFSQIDVVQNFEKPFNISYTKKIELKNSGEVRIWFENNWVNIEKLDKSGNLVWRILLAKIIKGELPKITEINRNIRISYNNEKYFITFDKWEGGPHTFVRGYQEDALNSEHSLFYPEKYGLTGMQAIGVNNNYTTKKWEKDGWHYISTGPKLGSKVSGIYRTTHTSLEEDNSSSSSTGYYAKDNNHFFWDGNFVYVEQMPGWSVSENINKVEILKKGFAPPIVTNNWFYNESFNSLSQLKGKVVLLYFWATWCYPCLNKMPMLDFYYDKYKDDGLIVIGIHHFRKSNQIDKYVKDHPEIDFPLCVASEKTTNDYYATWGIPLYFIINREGKIEKALLTKMPSEELLLELLNQ